MSSQTKKKSSMIVLAWVISLIAAIYLGYVLDRVLTRIKKIEKALEEKVTKKRKEGKSYFYDPYDPVQQAKIEREKMMAKLNPEE